jgi:ElaB/YqjD/DUF883 family membrane-anchored ribosome-binding protein
MADQRPSDHPATSPAAGGTQVRERAQEAGAQVRDKAQEMVRQGAETASAAYQQGGAVAHTLEDAIRAKPLQAMCIAAGVGLFLGVLVKK